MGGARTRRPGPRLALEPWPGRPGRWMCRPCADLDRRYADAVAGVAAQIEAALGPEVHAGRVVSTAPLRLEPWREARGRMAERAVEMRRASAALLTLDVARCFDRIRHDVVLRELAALGIASERRDGVAAVLAEFAEAGVPGLPVGPPASSVLANATLARLDASLRRRGHPHVRWIDDVAVFAGDAPAVTDALRTAGAALSALGLSVRPDKMRVIRLPHVASRRIRSAGPFPWLASLACDADAPACLGDPRLGPDPRRLDPPAGRSHRGHRLG